MIVDLMVNLTRNDGSLVDPEALIASAKRSGLDGVVVTQNGSAIANLASFRALGEAQGITVFAGRQLATNHGLILCIVPNPESAFEEGWAAMEDGIFQAASVIDAVEDRGGVTVALRPYDRDVARPMGDHLFSLQGLSACEVQNGTISEIANDLALEAASNMEMPCVGTSGWDGELSLGRAATLFREPVTTEAALCEAIRKGDCWPVSFSTNPPRGEDPQRSGRGPSRGHRGGGRSGGGDRGRGGRGPQGRDRSVDSRGDGGGQGRSRRRGRGGRGRGGGGGAGGFGSGQPQQRGPRQRGPADEDAGNRIRPADNRADSVNDDIGNRLAPGEASPYVRRPGRDEFHDDE